MTKQVAKTTMKPKSPGTIAVVKAEDVPTLRFPLKAPVDFFERLDRWREAVREKEGRVVAPDRGAAIRWIVHQFLLKQEEANRLNRKRRRR
jgi:hypothetical protein